MRNEGEEEVSTEQALEVREQVMLSDFLSFLCKMLRSARVWRRISAGVFGSSTKGQKDWSRMSWVGGRVNSEVTDVWTMETLLLWLLL